jgi:hypothetical protein
VHKWTNNDQPRPDRHCRHRHGYRLDDRILIFRPLPNLNKKQKKQKKTTNEPHNTGNPDPYRDPLDRVFDWGEIKADEGHDEIERKVQAARCMDCGKYVGGKEEVTCVCVFILVLGDRGGGWVSGWVI